MIHLDTHVAVWVFDRRARNLSNVQGLPRREDVKLSPMALFEYEVLLEKGRFPDPAEDVLSDLRDRVGLTLSTCQFEAIVARARSFAWTRDPFDRLIVANAMADGARLVTADERILANFKGVGSGIAGFRPSPTVHPPQRPRPRRTAPTALRNRWAQQAASRR